MSDNPETPVFGQVALDMTRQFWGRAEGATKAMMYRNNETARFISDRICRDIETLGRITQCTRLQDVFEIEADWFRTTLGDYARGANKLIEVNKDLLSWVVEDTQEAIRRLDEPAGSAAHQAVGQADAHAEVPAMGNVAETVQGPSEPRGIGIAIGEGRQDEDGASVASGRGHQQAPKAEVRRRADQRDALAQRDPKGGSE
jgi:hypothetical protein